MSFLIPSTSVDLNDPKYANVNAMSFLVQNQSTGKYECVDRPEDGVLCLAGGAMPKWNEIEQQPCPPQSTVDICGCGGCGAAGEAGGAGEDGVSAEEQAAMTATAMAASQECIDMLATALAEKAA